MLKSKYYKAIDQWSVIVNLNRQEIGSILCGTLITMQVNAPALRKFLPERDLCPEVIAVYH